MAIFILFLDHKGDCSVLQWDILQVWRIGEHFKPNSRFPVIRIVIRNHITEDYEPTVKCRKSMEKNHMEFLSDSYQRAGIET